MEKADRTVLNLFLQIFDEGWCTDGRGRKVYFSDTVIIMTSNMAAQFVAGARPNLGFGESSAKTVNAGAAVVKEVERELSPELINRIEVPYKVAINESVELAKIFGATESHKYVNGVLDKLAQKVRAVEIKANRGK